MGIRVSHVPPKVWDYSQLLSDLDDAVRARVVVRLGSSEWESILFTLPNEPPFACRIEARLADGTASEVEPDSVIGERVQALVEMFKQPPATSWTRLMVEYLPDNDSIVRLR